ncbi:MAG TPA: hypothetical protein VF533_17950, partial [Solirubrobacteraceae bacterium]
LFAGDPADGTSLAARARAEAPLEAEDLRHGLEAVELAGCFFGSVDPGELVRLEPWRAGPRGTGPGARTLTALTSLALAVRAGPAGEAAALAREALEGDVLFEADPGVFPVGAMQALALAEPAAAMPYLRRTAAFAERRGSGLDRIAADLWGGWAQLWAGDLRAAEVALERAFASEQFWGPQERMVLAYNAAFLALVRLERGDPERGWAALRRAEPGPDAADGTRFWLATRAELLLADGRPDEALADAERLRAGRAPETHPVFGPWRGLGARALAARGERAPAVEMAAEELALARRIGAPWLVGRGLRQLGVIEGGEAGLEHLREAVARLAPTSARLELAKAQAALGDALAAAGRRDQAAEPWGAAAALAAACGADGLAARLGAELAAARSGALSRG